MHLAMLNRFWECSSQFHHFLQSKFRAGFSCARLFKRYSLRVEYTALRCKTGLCCAVLIPSKQTRHNGSVFLQLKSVHDMTPCIEYCTYITTVYCIHMYSKCNDKQYSVSWQTRRKCCSEYTAISTRWKNLNSFFSVCLRHASSKKTLLDTFLCMCQGMFSRLATYVSICFYTGTHQCQCMFKRINWIKRGQTTSYTSLKPSQNETNLRYILHGTFHLNV